MTRAGAYDDTTSAASSGPSRCDWRPASAACGRCAALAQVRICRRLARPASSCSRWSALWWRLASGPIELDVATPWLTAAIKENFGSGHEVEIGGTQLERDANGRTSLRIRDIVVRDAEGTVVASAPKAEVGISGCGLFTGRIRAERLSLVGAEMAVRIESDSNVTVFAGSNKRPFVTASARRARRHRRAVAGRTLPTGTRPAAHVSAAPAPCPRRAARGDIPDFAALLAWIERLDASGLDGRDLTEIGLKGGNLTVDDQRNGKQWTFTNIDLGVTRPKGGGLAVTLGSETAERPWLMRAALTPGPARPPHHRHRDAEGVRQGHHARDAARRCLVRAGPARCRRRIRADIGPDGVPYMVDGRILVDKGSLVDLDDPQVRIADRPRRNQSRMGCDAPHAGDAVPDRVRRQSPHAARRRPMRRARAGGAVGAQDIGRDGRARVRGAGRRQSAGPQPHPVQAADRSRRRAASTSSRARSATRISASRCRAASTFRAAIRGSPSASPAPACRLRR